MRLGDGAHLGYCTNVVPADSAAEVLASLSVPARVRELCDVPALGLGLYLSRRAADELDVAQLRDALAERGLYVFTLNGFPYGDFHAERVKEAVYRPDWTDPRRAEHTLKLASILDALAPDDVAEPTISTVPLGWRAGWSEAASDAAARALVEVAAVLAARAQRRGRAVRICLEPEPGCVLERAGDVLDFFYGPLTRAAAGTDLVRRHLGVCYDTCHQAVAFEDPHAVIEAFVGAGIVIGKAQLSSALELADPADAAALAELARFAEPRYLHQVRCGAHAGGARVLMGCDDLPQASDKLPRDRAWRSHFHVPVDRDRFGRLGTTRPDLERAIARLRHTSATRQFEVETYTWSVLPEAERPHDAESLAAGLARELTWTRGRFA